MAEARVRRGESSRMAGGDASCQSRDLTSKNSIMLRLKQAFDKVIDWKTFEPYTPALTNASNCKSRDCIVGLTLHCFILSSLILGVAAAKLSWFGLKFAFYVLLNYAIFRGDITPIQEDNTEPITQEQIKEATIFDSCGLKVILLQKFSPLVGGDRGRRLMSPMSRLTPSRLYDSGSDSSQDIFSISSMQ